MRSNNHYFGFIKALTKHESHNVCIYFNPTKYRVRHTRGIITHVNTQRILPDIHVYRLDHHYFTQKRNCSKNECIHECISFHILGCASFLDLVHLLQGSPYVCVMHVMA